nr:hypothetical protein [Acidobacteriota bacterium]
AQAQERLIFPAVEDAQALILEKIRNEQVRLDIAVWYLVDRDVSTAIVNKHKAGVPVRVLGDRAALFEADPNTRVEFEYLAANGVPIRLRFHPTWFPEIMHWKCGIFVGQNLVEFGSANWTAFELKPWSPSNFKDETVMFTDDTSLVRAFLTKFDQMWADTQYFLDWHAAYKLETGIDWPTAMFVSRARLEPDYPTNVPGMVWSQGPELNAALVAAIDSEPAFIDMVVYRLSDPAITDALIRRRQAGVPVRIFIEPLQYREPTWPEYWITGAQIDRLWLAGVPIKQRLHEGLTHMKTLITSSVALNGSANFTRNWQRDHNYFISAVSKPTLYSALRDRFNAMWQDTRHYANFVPQRPEEPTLAGPPENTTGVSTIPRLEWNRARWAVAFDVYLGTSPQALLHQGRVNARLDEDPPATYSWTPGGPLQANTRYYWHIVSRTHATTADPTLVVRSVIRSFSTGSATAGPWGSGGTATGIGCTTALPAPGWICVNGSWTPDALPPSAPTAGGSSSCATGSPGIGWTCMNGGWLPPGHPDSIFAPAPPPPPSPVPPPSGGCATPQPVAGWLCGNGGWMPPELLPAGSGSPGAGAPAPPPTIPTPVAPPSCASPAPGAGWACVNGGWLPLGHPAALCGGTADPFLARGGGTCVNGSWVSPVSTVPPSTPAPGSCTTPDPFAAIGGGICVNGGWIPWTNAAAGSR